MDATVRKVDYFYLEASNKVGEGARLLSVLRDAGVNLLAFSGFPKGGKAQLDFIPEETHSFKAAAKKMGAKLSAKKTGFLVQGTDHVGAVHDILSALAGAKINLVAMDAVSAGEGRYGAIFWVKPADVKKTARVLGAS